MKPLNLDEIGRKHKLAMLDTATGRVLALACCEIEDLRIKVERLQIEHNMLAPLYEHLCALTDPEWRLVGIHEGPEREALQIAFDEAVAFYEADQREL